MKKWRILFIGDLNVYSTSYARANVMESFGHEVIRLSHTKIGGNDTGCIEANMIERIAWKLGFTLDSCQINSKLSNFSHFIPNIVWIEKGNVIKPRTLKMLKHHFPDTIIVGISEDDMVAWHNRTWDYTFGLKYYDVVFTTKTHNCGANGLAQFHPKRVSFIYKSYNESAFYPMILCEEDKKKYGADVSFVGSYEKERAESLHYLSSNGVTVRIWGNGWKKYKKRHQNMNVEHRPIVNTHEDLAYTKALCASKINLCFLRKMNQDKHTDRSIEIPASGSFMLAERTPEHEILFKENHEAVFFSSNEELLEKTKYYLTHSCEREQIAMRGRERCLQSGYSFSSRVQSILTRLEELVS